ncbi:hypothetical protein C8R44DRAFT_715545 [Mycena epipterygia]|nr:hypothetical protein C8R44DRAFT_715545 [Mycena epipterygia]
MSIISHLTLDQFHKYCGFHLGRSGPLPLDTFQLGTVVSLQGESFQEIAHIPNLTIHDDGWMCDFCGPNDVTVMGNGWSRMHSSQIIRPIVWTLSTNTNYPLKFTWLSQANHVFSQLAIPEDCFLVHCIVHRLSFSGRAEDLPEGYLFLCPFEDLRSTDGTWLATTECPAYWSLDPAGGSRLRPEDASNLGFLSFTLTSEAQGYSWPENMYAALSRFHAGKGFDPNSQDIARHLGYPIFELSCTPNVECAHSEYQWLVVVMFESDFVKNTQSKKYLPILWNPSRIRCWPRVMFRTPKGSD